MESDLIGHLQRFTWKRQADGPVPGGNLATVGVVKEKLLVVITHHVSVPA